VFRWVAAGIHSPTPFWRQRSAGSTADWSCAALDERVRGSRGGVRQPERAPPWPRHDPDRPAAGTERTRLALEAIAAEDWAVACRQAGHLRPCVTITKPPNKGYAGESRNLMTLANPEAAGAVGCKKGPDQWHCL